MSGNSAVLTGIAIAIAVDLYRYGRDVVRRRHTWLLVLLLVAAAAARSLRSC